MIDIQKIIESVALEWESLSPKDMDTAAGHAVAFATEVAKQAVLAEREACAKLMSDASLEAVAVSHERFARYSAECADMIRMRSNAGDKPPVGLDCHVRAKGTV